MGAILPKLLAEVGRKAANRPDIILAAWPDVIGACLAPMTKALAFTEGVLVVKVNNSTLHSLLVQHEKGKLIRALKKRFPRVGLKDIRFRIG